MRRQTSNPRPDGPNAADPDGDLPKDQIKESGVGYTENPDGSIKIYGYLDPLLAAGFKTAFDHEKQVLFDQDQHHGDIRCEYRRGSSALMNLISRGFQREDGTFPVPMFDFVVSEPVAEAILAQLLEPDDDIEVPIGYDDVDGRCETIDGTPIHPYLMSLVVGLGRFRRHIFRPDRGGQAWLCDTALCMIWWVAEPGLSPLQRTYHWLQSDHIYPRSKGGPTNTANGEPKCGPDNMWKGSDPDRAA